MNHADFTLGGTFRCGGGQWRCTDIGRRTVIAIRIDSVTVAGTGPERTLTFAEAEAAGCFNGPPYAVVELVFDEDDMEGCTTDEEGPLP
jgi:hypothetical protein|nr:hypothetical protein [uncultured Rhodopila sp.]